MDSIKMFQGVPGFQKRKKYSRELNLKNVTIQEEISSRKAIESSIFFF